MSRDCIVSGIRATGDLHIGNYIGAMKTWMKTMDDHPGASCFFFIADLHALAPPTPPEELRASVREITAAYVACGLDTDRAVLFAQSAVPGHAYLQWLLSSVTPLGWLNRMTQFKEKAGKQRDNAPLALYAYPVLQAADVLLYGATHVPVGEDQKQHIELARDIAGAFNRRCGEEVLVLPEPIIQEEGARIMSLRDGTKKMSKSDESPMSRINLTDDADTIAQKIRKAKTDSDPLPEALEELEGRPEALNLLTIYGALTDRSAESVLVDFTGQNFGQFKPALAEIAVETLGPMTKRMNELLAAPDEIDRILAAGAERANAAAEKILQKTIGVTGLSVPGFFKEV